MRRPTVFLFDIDGMLAHNGQRHIFDQANLGASHMRGATSARRVSRPTILTITSGPLSALTTTAALPQPAPIRTFRGRERLTF